MESDSLLKLVRLEIIPQLPYSVDFNSKFQDNADIGQRTTNLTMEYYH